MHNPWNNRRDGHKIQKCQRKKKTHKNKLDEHDISIDFRTKNTIHNKLKPINQNQKKSPMTKAKKLHRKYSHLLKEKLQSL